jgi:hypothetical protein
MSRPPSVPFFVRHTVVKNLQKASELPKGPVQLEYNVTTLLYSGLIEVIFATVTMGEWASSNTKMSSARKKYAVVKVAFLLCSLEFTRENPCGYGISYWTVLALAATSFHPVATTQMVDLFLTRLQSSCEKRNFLLN